MNPEKLGSLLLKTKLLSEDHLTSALVLQKKSGGKLGGILVKEGFIDDKALLTFLSKQYGVKAEELSGQSIDPEVVKLVPSQVAIKHRVLAIRRSGQLITLAMVDPTDIFAIDDIKFMTSYDVDPVIASEASIVEAINKYYGLQMSTTQKTSMLEAKDYTLGDGDEGDSSEFDALDDGPMVEVEDFDSVVGDALDNIDVVEEQPDEGVFGEVEAPIVKLVNGVLINAIKLGASDIHFEPYETVFRVRFRLDGVMRTTMNLPLRIKNATVSRLKIMSKLDISERRLPQDGRIKLKLGKKRDVDFRVSTLPCLFGEKVVMRILDKSNLTLDLTKLGFEKKPLENFTQAIRSPYGMVLVTGPTGSGKTTTLYSALSTINNNEINIMTAEDPVEYNLMGINQVQMKEDIGLNFSRALRAFLRQDPDVVMVGEIRDLETAEIGVKAALTGHLVLSTLHTNDAPSTINRLLNMGVEPFLVSSSVIMIVAQRLVRKVCENCKEEEKILPKSLIEAGFKEEELENLTPHRGKGCDACGKIGNKGRVALYEVMPVGESMREAILKGMSGDELKKMAISDGMQTLRRSGLQKVREGVSSLEEVVSATFSD